MEPKMCVKKLLFLVIIILFLLDAAKCEEEEEEDDSEELKRKAEPVYIIPDEKVFTHSVKDSRVITCNGSNIYWSKPNGDLVDSKKGRVHVEDDSSFDSETQSLRLIFERIQEDDNGIWTCVGKYDEKSFIMFVYVPIEFESVQQMISVTEHENVTLNCIVYGNPSPTVHWYFKGNRISNVEEEFSSHFLNMTDGLFIQNVGRHHSGEYTCKAIQMTSKSVTDMKELDIQLNVQYIPEIFNSGLSNVNGKFDVKNSVYTKYAEINSNVSLICEAVGNPLPTFLWYHNGKKLSHHHINNTDYFSILTVHLHLNKTFGDYKCIARNILGQNSMKINIIEAKRPETPQTFTLKGYNDKVLDIDVGSKKPDPNDTFAVTQYRFEMMYKDDYEKNGFEWRNPFITDEIAESNVTYMLIDLKPNTTYSVRVAAINAVGLSNWTEIKQFTTLAQPPNSNSCVSNFNIYLYLIVFAVTFLTKPDGRVK